MSKFKNLQKSFEFSKILKKLKFFFFNFWLLKTTCRFCQKMAKMTCHFSLETSSFQPRKLFVVCYRLLQQTTYKNDPFDPNCDPIKKWPFRYQNQWFQILNCQKIDILMISNNIFSQKILKTEIKFKNHHSTYYDKKNDREHISTRQRHNHALIPNVRPNSMS